MNMEWISVEERLPERHEQVLVACKGTKHVYTVYYSDKWKLLNCGGSYETREDAERYAFMDVTHWMPFPAAPERSGA